MRRLRAMAATPAYLLLLTLATVSSAIDLDISSPDSIKAAASTAAHGMMTFYYGNTTGGIPGLLGDPYYWWEAGGMFGSLIDYWYYTGDTTYNDVVTQGMLFQVGPTMDYMPPNQTKSEGNDDQVFWGFAAMSAAEYNFPNPPSDQPQWLALAQGVWNSQALRWDAADCGGGLRWQIFTFNTGYDYKNSPSNSGFINLGARLYAYTGNQTYADWVEKTWDWMQEHALIGGQSQYSIYDGVKTEDNCTTVNHIQWTYSAGMMLNAAAVMYNVTSDSKWQTRAEGIWASSSVFFKNQILYEAACEPPDNCNTDQLSFKAYFIRWMAASIKVMPEFYSKFQPYFEASAKAAASTCTGTNAGIYNAACSIKWTEGPVYDGRYGVGQQMSAMEAIGANLIQQSKVPVAHDTGGTSKGDPTAGSQGDAANPGAPPLSQITTGDKAGAGILTAIVLVGMLGGTWWMIA